MVKLIILTDWYSPAYKAGGPITSLNNLVNSLSAKLNCTIITSAYDLGDNKILQNIIPDSWQSINNSKIKYLTNSKTAANELVNAGYDFIYLNSMFSPSFTIRPLLKARSLGILHKVILAPRGMLQEGALKQKALKKKIFFLIFKLTGIANNIHFHATDEQEKEDILKQFPKAKKITVIPNVVCEPELRVKSQKSKVKSQLRLVYLSVISSKKNLKYLLDIFKYVEYDISFNVYGSIKDKNYWNSFAETLKSLKHIKFEYHGDISNHKVTETISNYDFFILPTLGENFGHAIYEALGSGTPVIISDKTPWRNLEMQKAGWDIPLDNKYKFVQVLNKCYEMDNDEYQLWSKGAHNFAKNYYEENDPTEEYLKMFGVRG